MLPPRAVAQPSPSLPTALAPWSVTGCRPRAGVPSPELTAALGDRRRFARFALELETGAIAAYVRALPELRDAGMRQPLGSIMACGGTHQVALRDALGEPLLRTRTEP